jgi:hypothetical protein
MDYNQWMEHISRELLKSKAKLKRHSYEEANKGNRMVGGLSSNDIPLQSAQSSSLSQVDDR